jgi:hypothetical protein
MTRTDIRDYFGRNKKAEEIDEMLERLDSLGHIEVEREQTRGRPREVARPKRQNDDFDTIAREGLD